MFNRLKKVQAATQESVVEVTLYLRSHKVTSRRKRKTDAKWLTEVPAFANDYFVTKVKVDITKYRCEKLPFGGFIVYIPPAEHLRLMNKSKFIRKAS
ncbi:hypothetical protein AWM68_17345 [Fictibacillus phosphorivorans]|uniref:Uncharacterized protein n=1 Tax=Fictibacillus phosphorivorans TaxID=1221500 RepID=A0A163S162_9BACL|nr:hypothetical protein [Fictibacillus phosphorivorans]KZE67938.1 hypothetical protein AWM68_17345 [Fictibacillus phosphorivorans]